MLFCKPTVTTLPLQPVDGPCDFSIRSFNNVCASVTLSWSMREAVANVLRQWADKAEGVQSFVLVANGPPQITFSDVGEAMAVGINAASQYLNDLWRDRVFGSTDT